MKRIISSLLLIIGTLSAFAQGEELTETRLFNPFDKIIATNGVNVILVKSSQNKAEVRISNALLSDVITEVKNNKLIVKMRPQFNKDVSVLVKVYYKSLQEVIVTKGASLETKTDMLTDILSFNANTGGKIKAEVQCKDLKAKAAGGATISLYGWANRFEGTANTKGQVISKKLESDNAIIRATGGGEVWVNPKLYLEAVANTGGAIYYINEPDKKNEKVSSGGSVESKIPQTEYDLIRDKEI